MSAEPSDAEPTLPAETETTKVELRETERIEYPESADTESVSAKARESGKALKELVMSLANKTKTTIQQKTQQLKDAADDDKDAMVVQDAVDIQRLGALTDGITSIFEGTMDKINSAPAEQQTSLYNGFKKVLEEEVNVIDARLNLAKRMPTAASGLRNEQTDASAVA